MHVWAQGQNSIFAPSFCAKHALTTQCNAMLASPSHQHIAAQHCLPCVHGCTLLNTMFKLLLKLAHPAGSQGVATTDQRGAASPPGAHHSAHGAGALSTAQLRAAAAWASGVRPGGTCPPTAARGACPCAAGTARAAGGATAGTARAAGRRHCASATGAGRRGVVGRASTQEHSHGSLAWGRETAGRPHAPSQHYPRHPYLLLHELHSLPSQRLLFRQHRGSFREGCTRPHVTCTGRCYSACSCD